MNVHSMYGPSGHTIVVNCEFTIYISNYPSVENGVLKYSGGVQTPVFVNYDMNQLDISGTYSATNTGEYIVTFSPKEGYGFADGSTSKDVSWGIYYIWEKYNVDTSQRTVYTDNTVGYKYPYSLETRNLTCYKSYTLNPDTGKYSTSGQGYTYQAYTSYTEYIRKGYIYAVNPSRTSQLYQVTGTLYDEVLYYTLHEAKASTITDYSKGSTNYGQVHSTNVSEYPDNDKSDDYWYVKQ